MRRRLESRKRQAGNERFEDGARGAAQSKDSGRGRKRAAENRERSRGRGSKSPVPSSGVERALPVPWPRCGSEDSPRLVPAGRRDRAPLQDQRVRPHRLWMSHRWVYQCTRGLQPCDHTRLLFFVHQTQMLCLELAQITPNYVQPD